MIKADGRSPAGSPDHRRVRKEAQSSPARTTRQRLSPVTVYREDLSPTNLLDRIAVSESRLLCLLAVVGFFDAYDGSVMSLALSRIVADLQLPSADVGLLGAAVRLGALPSPLFGALADRFGRQRVLLGTIIAYTVLTALTAVAWNPVAFISFQLAARAFTNAEHTISSVVIAEEYAPGNRGWGTGALMSLSSMGHVLAFVLYAAIDALPLGWRTLYLVGIVPLTVAAWLRRSLAETAAFERAASVSPLPLGRQGRVTSCKCASCPQKPLVYQLARAYPRRLLVLVSISALQVLDTASLFFAPAFLQERHVWSPAKCSALGLFGGLAAMTGGPIGGRLSDKLGRRAVVSINLVLSALAQMAFYRTTPGGTPAWAVAALWTSMVFLTNSSGATLVTASNELFCTQMRSTASGVLVCVKTIAGALSLGFESLLFAATGSHWAALSCMAGSMLFGPLIVCPLPESSGETLPDVPPDQCADGPRRVVPLL